MLKFIKMQGIGNDYIFIDNIKNCYKYNFKTLSKILCKRHFYIGGDGIIVLTKSRICDVKMQIYNSDGSKAKVCGNATRCVAFYIYKILNKKVITIESSNKILKAKIKQVKNNLAYVEVDMGQCKYIKNFNIKIGGKNALCNIASIGNKHCIVFVSQYNFDIKKIGEKINKLDCFKGGVNIEFVKILDKNNIEMKVYERGSGITLACGSGACASAYVCYLLNKVDKKQPINVKLDGGELKIIINKKNVVMNGVCKFVFKGELNWR